MMFETAVSARSSWSGHVSISSHASFSLRPVGDAMFSSRPVPAAPRDPHYAYSWEDLSDIDVAASTGKWDSQDGAPPTSSSISWTARIMALLQEMPAPEVSALENGTMLLLWKVSDGFLSVEIGDNKYGLIALREGLPSVRMNGETVDLVASLPDRRRSGDCINSSVSNLWTAIESRVSGLRGRLDVSGSLHVLTA